MHKQHEKFNKEIEITKKKKANPRAENYSDWTQEFNIELPTTDSTMHRNNQWPRTLNNLKLFSQRRKKEKRIKKEWKKPIGFVVQNQRKQYLH